MKPQPLGPPLSNPAEGNDERTRDEPGQREAARPLGPSLTDEVASAPTPTPWHAVQPSGNNAYAYVNAEDGTQHVATTWGSIRADPLTNAAYIVRCVNAYDELIRALQTCHAELVTLKARLAEPYRSNVAGAAEIAGRALAKAER